MADVWEMEVQRARTWLRSEARADVELRQSIFQRVNNHMAFVDHSRALRRSQEEDGDDLAGLDFLDDVDAEDMTALLQAEAVRPSSSGQVTATAMTSAVSTVTAVDTALKPIAMPSHLLSGVKTKPAVYGASAATMTPTTTGMSLSSDENVKALMQDLQLDVHVHSDVEDERKTEESTPPHVTNGFQDASISAVKVNTKRVGASALLQPNTEAVKSKLKQVEGSNSQDQAKKKPEKPVDPEAVASEMLSWVSGERDPSVLQRKEALTKRNRKRTRHFGVGSAEEQRYVQQKIKYYTQDSDSDDMSARDDNDYSPSEDPADFEPDEPVDNEEMLSDDYLNSDGEARPKKKRKRLKRLKKPSTTKRKTEKMVTGSKAVEQPATTASARKSDHVDGTSATMIDLSKSDDDATAAEGTATSRMSGRDALVKGQHLVLQRLKKAVHGLGRETKKATSSTLKKSHALPASLNSVHVTNGADDGYETPELASDGYASDKENGVGNEQAGDGGDFSDTGTVDFDFDADVTQDTQRSSDPIEHPEPARASKPNDAGDVSDTDTVVLDEGPESDDLGLDYSDISDRDADRETEDPTSVPGVQQFFDYKPLKLKPKRAVETRKMIPVHPEADFVKEKKASKALKPVVDSSSQPSTSTGSNGLRPKKLQPLEMSVTMKGKHPVARRSIKVLDKGQTPRQASNSAATRQAHAAVKQTLTESPALKQRYAQPDRPTGSNGLRKATKGAVHSVEAGTQDEAADDSSARYLSYSGSSGATKSRATKSGGAKSAPTRPTPTVAPSRFGGGGSDLSAGPTLNAVRTAEYQFRRDPQMSIYDALHIDGKEESSAFLDRDAGYKRPSAFKKLQAESARTGVSIVSSKAKEPDWDRIPIPKKGIGFTSGAPEPRPKAADTAVSWSSKKTEKPSRYGDSGRQSSRDKSSKGGRGKAHKGGGNTQRPSYYGPSNDSASRRRSWSPSPPRSSYKRHDESESRGGRGGDKKRRVSSRSPSPRGRDRDWDRGRDRSSRETSREKKSSKHRGRSPSPRKRSRSADRGGGAHRSEKDSKKRSVSPPRNSSASSYRGVEDYMPKKHKTTGSSRVNAGGPRRGRSASPEAGALASFGSGDDMYISDSDNEIVMEVEKREDIRFDLEGVAVDPALMARRVYVTGFNPAICGEELEDIFAQFGVESDRDTGFPAIDVFTCQRTLKARGDACVTFVSEDGALAAVEELNAKHVKSSLIGVRRMDVHTQRVLNAQFEVVRDTWKCPGTRCRADVSTWDYACPKCRRKRCFGSSHHKITRDSWLCSICFMANDKYDNDCKGCGESLPDAGRFASYRN